MPDADYYIRQNDIGLILRTFCEDANGAVVDLTGATVRFHMKAIGGTTTKIATAAANENATATGRVSYTFTGTDADTAGLFLGEFQVTFGGGAVQTFPNAGFILVRITEQVA